MKNLFNHQNLTIIFISLFSILVLALNLPQFFSNLVLPRQVITLFLALVLALIFSYKIAKGQKIEIFSSAFFLPLILFSFINFAAAFSSPGTIDALKESVTLAALSLTLILIPQIIRSLAKTQIALSILILAASASGLNPSFNNAALLLLFLPIILALVFPFLKKLTPLKLFFGIIILSLYLFSSYTNLKALYPFKEKLPVFLGQKEGWIVALETIKNRPLLGVGPGNFINAYTLYKPLFAPNIAYQNLDFLPSQNSSNSFFQILTTAGVLGLFSYLLFILAVLARLIPKNPSEPILIGIFISFVIFLILSALIPVHLILTFFIFIFLGLSQSLEDKPPRLIISLEENEENQINLLPFLLTFFLALVMGYLSYRLILGEYYEKITIDAAVNNDAQKAFEFAQKAVDQNPLNDTYRSNLAQIAFAIGSSNLAQKGQDLTEEDKNNISQIFQKAIAEGKEAVNLNSQKVYNLQTLATIYAGLVKVAPNTEQFAVDTYQKAISIDPTNPRLRLELGGIFFGRNEFATASAIFRNAVFLQANYANAHYNLGHSLLRLNQFEEGINEITNAVSLLPDENKDKERVLKEIEDIKAQIASVSGSPKPSPKPTPRP